MTLVSWRRPNCHVTECHMTLQVSHDTSVTVTFEVSHDAPPEPVCCDGWFTPNLANLLSQTSVLALSCMPVAAVTG